MIPPDRAGGAGRRPTLLFALAHAGFFRNFESVIDRLLRSGVDVHVHLSKVHKSISLDDYQPPGAGAPGRFTSSMARLELAASTERTRIMRDIIHYSRPAFSAATDLRARLLSLQKDAALSTVEQAMFLERVDHATEAQKDAADTYLAACEEATPADLAAAAVIDAVRPDYVIISPLVNFGSREVDIVKAAHARGLPTLLATASWDNLTNKGVMKVRPRKVAVWNRQMREEATALHGVPSADVWMTGAPLFDTWFERKPSRDRQTFCRSLGLDPARPLVVYLCSSAGIAGNREYDLVKRWRAALAIGGPRLLKDLRPLVRPHPMALAGWHKRMELHTVPGTNRGERWGVTVWPLTATHPVQEESRADFFDTLHHADAVVGLNTSAMIEAAILRKPVLTFLGHDRAASQAGNLHFQHLTGGGFMFEARDLDEHAGQLAAVLESPRNFDDACDRFVADFVRPLGRDVPASAQLASLILANMAIRPGLDAEDAALSTADRR